MKPRLQLLAFSLIASCSGPSERHIGQHVFDVPVEYDISDSARPFFLPPSKSGDGFTFHLNPEADLPHRNLIGVDSKVRVCRRAEGTEAYVNATICTQNPKLWRGIELIRSDDGAFWTYDLPADSDDAKPAPLISCFAMADQPKEGLCTAVLPYRDLVLKIYLRDDQVNHLEALYDEAASMLKHWER